MANPVRFQLITCRREVLYTFWKTPRRYPITDCSNVLVNLLCGYYLFTLSDKVVVIAATHNSTLSSGISSESIDDPPPLYAYGCSGSCVCVVEEGMHDPRSHWGQRDRSSAFACCVPGLCSMAKLNCCSLANQRSNMPCMFLRFVSHSNAAWSVLTRKWGPQTYHLKWSSVDTTANSSRLVVQYFCCAGFKLLLWYAITYSVPLTS